MSWTPDDLARLEQLVADKKTLQQIADTMGRTKNAIAGIMNRRGLKSQSGKTFTPPERKPKPRKRKQKFDVKQFLAERKEPKRMPVPVQLVLPDPQTDRYGKATCQWPIGDPKTVEFHMCGDVRIHGKPYCHAHCLVAYQKPRERAEKPFLFQKQRLEAAE